ncbi:unnamed protein product [Somion occarium]|uniref:F-box domain-containing protein n=1 Tax=Somion occarium TaxID=3059160 RepID=A0ABP1E2M5_9APHY
MDSKIARKVARSKIPPPPDGRCIINQLPPELLAYIFQLGVELEAEGEDDEDLFSDISSETEEEKPYLPFEVLVSHVCKHWRDIATNLPNLWTSIDFAGPYDRSITYLERAQQAPLDISLDLEDLDADDPEVKDLITIAGLILPRVSQWRTFELIVSDFSLMAIVLKNLSACPAAPILESLSLYNHDNIEDMDHFEPAALRDVPELLFNGNVPRLKKIALWGVHLLWERTPFLKNLEEIELAYHAEDVRPSYKVFTNMLKESPNLRSLALCNSGPAGGPVDWLESVTEGHEGEPVPPPTTQISLPSLNQLALTYESAPGRLWNLP